MTKVALYARVSTKDGRQDTENQLIALRDYCAKQGWKTTGEYVDHETGGTSKRQHFQKMFADAPTFSPKLITAVGVSHAPGRRPLAATESSRDRWPAREADCGLAE
jgi:hypothetical protein